MGLFVNANGIPVCMDVFRGNMSDSDTLKENLNGFKAEYGIKRTVVVANKGMNCSHNIDLLCSQGDGCVFSQVLKGTKGKHYQKDLFSPDGWQEAQDGSYRWKLITEEYHGHDIRFEIQGGNRIEKKPVTRKGRDEMKYRRNDIDKTNEILYNAIEANDKILIQELSEISGLSRTTVYFRIKRFKELGYCKVFCASR